MYGFADREIEERFLDCASRRVRTPFEAQGPRANAKKKSRLAPVGMTVLPTTLKKNNT
jgi:hypothetical protein